MYDFSELLNKNEVNEWSIILIRPADHNLV